MPNNWDAPRELTEAQSRAREKMATKRARKRKENEPASLDVRVPPADTSADGDDG